MAVPGEGRCPRRVDPARGGEAGRLKPDGPGPARGGRGERRRLAWKTLRRRPRARETAAFYFRLATLLDAGIPIAQALRQVGGSGRLGHAVSLLSSAAGRGEPLAGVLSEEPA